MNAFHKYAAKRHLAGLVKEALYGRKFLEAYRDHAKLDRATGALRGKPGSESVRAAFDAADAKSPVGRQLNTLSMEADRVSGLRRAARQAVLDGNLDLAADLRNEHAWGKDYLKREGGPEFKAVKAEARSLLGLPDRSVRAPASRSIFDRIRGMF